MKNLDFFNVPDILIEIYLIDGMINSTNMRFNPQKGFSCTIKSDIPNPDLENRIFKCIQKYKEKQSLDMTLPFDWSSVSPFTREVLQVLQSIPFASVMSYQDVAIKIGSPKGYRAVGNACGKNPFPLLIPCHRVIASDGSIGGFSSDIEIKRSLLAFENTV